MTIGFTTRLYIYGATLGLALGGCAVVEPSTADTSTAAQPGIVGQIPEEGKRTLTNRAKIFDVTGPRVLVGIDRGGCYFLIEARQLIGITARKPERAKEEYAFRVVYMIEQLAHGPLVGRIAMERLILGNRLQ